MMKLIPAPNSMKGIKKTSQISRTQNWAKILQKSQKKEKQGAHLEMRFNHKDQLYY
jgi:hypothetical protein